MDSRKEGFARFRAVAVALGALAVASAAMAGDHAWRRLGPDGGQVNALAIDPSAPATLYAGTDRGVFKSGDAGISWDALNVAPVELRVSALAIQASAPETLFAGTPNGVYKSTNGGASWTWANAGVPSDHAVVALAIDPKTPATLYAGTFVYFCEDYASCLFKSIDGGTSWTALHLPGSPYPLSITIDPVNPETLYVAATDGVYKSTDGGQGWAKLNLAAYLVSALAIDSSDPATLYAATSTTFDQTKGGGVFKTSDGGAHWSAMNTGLPNKGVSALAIDRSAPATLYAGTIGGGVFKSVDGGGSWTAMNAGLTYTNVFVLAVDPADPARVYSGTRGAVFAYEKLHDAGPCTPDATTLCLNDGRFQVRTQWATRDGSSGPGQARALTGETGYFTFFDPDNVELMVKVLNGCGSNGRFWTFAGGLTNVSVVMTVTDVKTGAVNTYTNPQDAPFQPIQDTEAFSVCDFDASRAESAPAGYARAALVPPIVSESFDASAAPCVADATTLCLNDSRFKVQAQWFTPDGKGGTGQGIPLTGDTGAFWFFSASNVEVVIKVLNGCSVNSRYWTFAGGLTNVDVTLTVTDTQTGNVKTYTNAQGTPFPPIQDTGAFVACP